MSGLKKLEPIIYFFENRGIAALLIKEISTREGQEVGDYVDTSYKGSPQPNFFGKSWDFVPTRGGGEV